MHIGKRPATATSFICHHSPFTSKWPENTSLAERLYHPEKMRLNEPLGAAFIQIDRGDRLLYSCEGSSQKRLSKQCISDLAVQTGVELHGKSIRHQDISAGKGPEVCGGLG